MSMDYIRKTYKVPAKRGGLVMWKSGTNRAQSGVITGTSGAYLRIRLCGNLRAGRFHPTDGITYLQPSEGEKHG